MFIAIIISLIIFFLAVYVVYSKLKLVNKKNDQTTPNMIQGLKGIFARKPLISIGI